MIKRLFWGQKILLSSGREIDISADIESNDSISVLCLLNHLDPIHKVTKPLSIRLEWEPNDSDPIVSFECRGGCPKDHKHRTESEMPIEGINGTHEVLKLSEINEIIDQTNKIYLKISKEAQ